jgi:hypothetical protein
VEATYHLYNKGDAVSAELFFVAGARIGDVAEVRIDDRVIAHTRRPRPELPAAWKPPPSTPRIGTGSALTYKIRDGLDTVLAFTLRIAPGEHILRVRCQAEAACHSSGGPTRYWQLAYVLAPAREWASFGTLDVSVLLPAGWEAASDPGLTRDGDRLIGTFIGLPADALALTVQSPPRFAAWVAPTIAVSLWSLAIVLGMVLCWRLGAARGRRLGGQGGSGARAWPTSLLAGGLWTGLLIGADVVATMVVGNLEAPPHQESFNQGYGLVFLFLFGLVAALLAVPAGLVLGQIAAYRAKSGLSAHGP